MRTLVRRLFARKAPVLCEATPADARAFASLHAESFHQAWSDGEFDRLLRAPNVVAHRLALGRDCIGFILSRMAADEAEILSVAVARSHRGEGMGRSLVEVNLRRLAGFGVQQVFLEVAANNLSARRMYQRTGFREVGRRKGYYAGNNGSEALILRRKLP
jgi:[ribosomal protein S18]-alanine N-acetyltransferase